MKNQESKCLETLITVALTSVVCMVKFIIDVYVASWGEPERAPH